jgi:ACS family D-galactonate transporter-like MFS transporter
MLELNINSEGENTMEMNQKIASPNVPKSKMKTKSNARFWVLALLFIGTAINYMDRTNISVTAPLIQKDLNLSPALLGLIFSAFGWTYALAQIPGGWLLDKYGPKRTYGMSLILWSIFTFMQGFATNFLSLFGMRLGLGLTEAPAFPTNNKVITTWFPQKERAFATGFYTAGEFVGLAFLTPFLFWLQATFGWSTVFFVTGAIGIIFALIWFKQYSNPNESKRINQAELDYIQQGGGLSENEGPSNKSDWSQLTKLFKHRQFNGILLGQFAISSTLYFFLTWFPTYLVKEKHLTMLKVGFVASLPFIAAFIGVIVGGIWSDWLLRRGKTVGFSRKTPIVTGLLLASTIIMANYTSSVSLIIAVMSFSFFGQGLSSISWSLLAEIAPAKLVGIAGGIFNFAGNLSGIITPLVIGFIVSATGSFTGALIVVGGIAVVGAISYIFIIGEVKRIEID